MKIEQILKQLTPERIEREVAEVQEAELPVELQKWVDGYEKVGDRDGYIWKWAYRVSQLITLPGVSKKYCESLVKTKFLIIMFIVLLDDVADKVQDKELLDELLKIPFEEDFIKINKLNKKEREYLGFTSKVWHSIERMIRTYPRYKKFKPLIEYDMEQVLNGMNYAYLVNRNLYSVSETESQIYLSYNTPATISYMIDLTCLPEFDEKKIGLIREVAWCGQVMTRISNWVSTWEREIYENDFTSGVFIYALGNNIVTTSGLRKSKKESINKIRNSRTEEYFLKQWEEFYIRINKLSKRLGSTNAKQIIRVINKLTVLHLASKKFI